MRSLGDLLDGVLEASVVGSYTRVGFAARRAFAGWDESPLPRLDGRVVVITGPTAGIGLAATRQLLALGATVEMIARNGEKAAATRVRLLGEIPTAEIAITVADLGSLADVRRAAETIASRRERVDVLIHNAGALDDLRSTSPEGVETTIATHLVGPYLLTRCLLPRLRAAGQASHAASPARILWVTSGGMYAEPLAVAKLEMKGETYDGVTVYARAKRAQMTLVELLGEDLPPAEIVVHAMHPGWADTPGVERSLPRFRALLRPLLRTPDQGADTIVFLATADAARETTGKLWLDRKIRLAHLSKRTKRAETPEERGALLGWLEARTGLGPISVGLDQGLHAGNCWVETNSPSAMLGIWSSSITLPNTSVTRSA